MREKHYLAKIRKLMAVLWAAAVIGALPLTLAAAENGGKAEAVVVYHAETRGGDNFPLIGALLEHLGHFDMEVRKVPFDEWRTGDLKDAALVIYAATENKKLPKQFLAEMASAKRVIWFERNIEQLAAYLKWPGFKMDGVAFSRWQFHYQEKELLNDWTELVLTRPDAQTEIIAGAASRFHNAPLAWRRDNVYFCGFIDLNENFMPMFGTLLHEFIPNEHARSPQALLRFEDINPFAEPSAVSSLVNAARQCGVPFAFSVTPVGVEEDGERVYLHQKPELVQVLKEAQNNGASIILHGYLGENEYKSATGESYEFWNGSRDAPLWDDEEFTARRLKEGLAELARCGLTPVAFEAPGYAMSEAGYMTLSRYFNILSGHIQLSDQSVATTVTLPYITKSPRLNNMIFIPENAGYYNRMPSSLKDMLQKTGQISNVPDGLACFYYHVYFPPENVVLIIEEVKKQGYRFLDLRRFPVKVRRGPLD